MDLDVNISLYASFLRLLFQTQISTGGCPLEPPQAGVPAPGSFKKRGFDLTSGQHLTWNWGIGQFLPLKKDQSVLLEAGPAGYINYQVTDDSGGAARNLDCMIPCMRWSYV